MKKLLLLELDGSKFALWENDIQDVMEDMSVHTLPFGNRFFAGVVQLEGHFLSIADLSVCMGYAPLKDENRIVLVLPEHKELAGFVIPKNIEHIEIDPESIYPIINCAKSELIDSCIVHNSDLIPLINISTLFRHLQNSNFEQVKHDLQFNDFKEIEVPDKKLHLVEIGNQTFALRATSIKDIFPLPEQMAVFGTLPKYVSGLILYNQKILPLVSLSQRIRFSEDARDHVVVLSAIGEQCPGFLVQADKGDAVEEMVTKSLPPLVRSSWIYDVLMLKDEIIPIIELETLILSKPDSKNEIDAIEAYNPSSVINLGSEDIEVVELSIIGVRHAIPKSEFVDTLEIPPLKRIPNTSPMVLGVVEYKDEVLPVLDMALCYGEISSVTPEWKMVLIRNGDFSAFIVTDEVFESLSIQADIQRKLPINLSNQFVYGCYANRYADSVVLILNIQNIAVHYDSDSGIEILKAFSAKFDQAKDLRPKTPAISNKPFITEAPKTVKVEKVEKTEKVAKLESAEDVEEVEESEEAEVSEEVEGLEDNTKIEPAEEVEESEEAEEIGEMEEPEDVEELEEAAEIEPTDDVEESEELEEYGDIGELEEGAKVELAEDLVESEKAEEAKESEQVEVSEEVEKLENLAKFELPGDVEKIEEVGKVDKLDEVTEIEEIEESEEVSQVELEEEGTEPEESEPGEEVGEIEESEALEEPGDIEKLEEGAKVELAEDVEESEEAEEAEESEPVEVPEEVEELEEIAKFELPGNVEKIEKIGEVDELDEVTKLEETEESEEVSQVELEEEGTEPEESEPGEGVGEIEKSEEPEEPGDIEKLEEGAKVELAEDVEGIEEAGEVEEGEPVEVPEEVEELEELEELEEIAKVGLTGEVVDIKEVDEVAELAEVTEIEEVEVEKIKTGRVKDLKTDFEYIRKESSGFAHLESDPYKSDSRIKSRKHKYLLLVASLLTFLIVYFFVPFKYIDITSIEAFKTTEKLEKISPLEDTANKTKETIDKQTSDTLNNAEKPEESIPTDDSLNKTQQTIVKKTAEDAKNAEKAEDIIPENNTSSATNETVEIKAPIETTPAPSYEYIDYVVEKGDYLFRITEQYTGNGYNYPKIQSENKIPNADLIYPDQVIKIKVKKETNE